MPIYNFPGASPSLRRAVNGAANLPHDIWNEGNVPSTLGLLQLGIRSESQLDIRFASAGEYLNTQAGDVISVRTANGENVLMVDVGNGAQNLLLLNRSVSAISASQAAAQPVSETEVSVTGVSAETAVSTVVPQHASAGAQASSEPELVAEPTPEELAAYSASISGGGTGASGAAAAAEYGTVADSTTVYEPPPPADVYYDPYADPYAPAAAPPPAEELPYIPGNPGYDEYAATQTALEELAALGLI